MTTTNRNDSAGDDVNASTTAIFAHHQNNAVKQIHHAIIQTARNAGVSVYLVGGMVRDGFLRGCQHQGQGATNTTDISMDTSKVIDMDYVPFGMDYQGFAELVARKLRTRGVQFKDNTRLNISPAKQQRLYGKNCSTTDQATTATITVDISKPRGSTIEGDLLARDFTINNLALSMTGRIVGNPYDILHSVVRGVSPNTFTDDPLRVLRAYRFQATLGFAIDPQTCVEMQKHQHLLSETPPERILKELQSIFASPNPMWMAEGLIAMGSSGIVPIILRGGVVNANTLRAIEGNACDVDGVQAWWVELQGYRHRFEVLFAAIFLPTDPSTALQTIKNASLPNSEQRLIRTLHKLCIASTLPLDTTTIWENYAIIHAIKWVYRLQNQHENLSNLEQTLSTINRSKGLTLTGDTLINAGFVPCKGFRQTLLEGQIAMATTNLDLGETVRMLKQRYSADGGEQQ